MILRQHRRWLLVTALLFTLMMVALMTGRTVKGDLARGAIYTSELFWSNGPETYRLVLDRALFAMGLGTALVVLPAIVLPGLLIIGDVLCLAFTLRFVVCGLGLIEPGASRLIELLGLLFCLVVLSSFYSGLIVAGKRWRRDLKWTLHFQTPAPPEIAFRRLVPSADTIEDYLIVGTKILGPPADLHASFVIAYPGRNRIGYLLEGIWNEVHEYPKRAVYRHASINEGAPLRFPYAGRRDILVTPSEEGSDVRIEVHVESVPIGPRLHMFLTEQPKDTVACWKARIEGSTDWSILGRTTIGPAPGPTKAASEVK